MDDDNRFSYAGYGLFAKLYKKLTKKDLNILPVVFKDRVVVIGKGFNILESESNEDLQNIAEEKFLQTKD